MAIKIDSEGTSVFPAVEAIDVRDTGREAEVIFATSITVVIFYWRILLISESMGHHDSEIMDDRSID